MADLEGPADVIPEPRDCCAPGRAAFLTAAPAAPAVSAAQQTTSTDAG